MRGHLFKFTSSNCLAMYRRFLRFILGLHRYHRWRTIWCATEHTDAKNGPTKPFALSVLGQLHRTDKSDAIHTFAGLTYLDVYVIEDLGCSYLPLQTSDDVRNNWPGMRYNHADEDLDNDRSDMDRFFLDRIRDLDHLRGDILFIHFWSRMCVIRKRSD